jgi:hypothetical protein
MIRRALEPVLKKLAQQYPVVTPGEKARRRRRASIPSGGTSFYGRTSQKPRPKVETRARVELGEM